MDFTDKDFANFRVACKEALRNVEQQFQVEIKLGQLNYDLNNFTINMEVAKDLHDGKTAEQRKFETFAESFGFKKTDYNCIVSDYSDENIEGHLIGFKPDTKHPYLIRTGNKDVYYCNKVKRF